MVPESLGTLGAFVGGALATAICQRPAFTHDNMGAFVKGGLWGTALQVIAVGGGLLALRLVKSRSAPTSQEESDKQIGIIFTPVWILGTVVGIVASKALANRYGLAVSYKEASVHYVMSAVVGTITCSLAIASDL
ncbi:MAG: hypothetical protein KBA81_02750 [Rhabdochlamydiaceae bacterium]|nr:hypothetical protein [Rhabdochlamydiaceae bacterium]